VTFGNTGVPAPIRRRKGSIEIYFVLYLSAIILLLGTTPARRASTGEELEEVIVGLLAQDFQVKSRQAALLYTFLPSGVSLDTTGVSLRHDTLNTVFAVGSFNGVEFSIVSITDSATGQSIGLDRASLAPTDDPRIATFQWKPGNEPENALYTITVQGRARPVLPATLTDPELRSAAAEVLKRRPFVYDSVSFSVTLLAIEGPERIVEFRKRDSATQAINLASAEAVPPTVASTGPAGALSLSVNDAQVLALPSSRWRNKVYINGAGSNELDVSATPPGIQISGGAQGYVELSGSAPAAGEQIVTVRARRRSDGMVQMVQFPVKATRLPDPPIPGRLYIGETYLFDFNVPGIAPGRVVVEVIENGRVVIARGNGSSTVRYTPSDVGKVTFNRYLDNVRVDETSADIDEPSPPALSYSPQGKVVIVTAIAFGRSWKGAENLPRLIVQEGENAEDPAPSGPARFEDDAKRWVQQWRVSRKNDDQPLEFQAYVLDQRGSSRGKSKVYHIIVQ